MAAPCDYGETRPKGGELVVVRVWHDKDVADPAVSAEDAARLANGRIAEAAEKGATSLDLDGLALTELPPALGELDAIEDLHCRARATLRPSLSREGHAHQEGTVDLPVKVRSAMDGTVEHTTLNDTGRYWPD